MPTPTPQSQALRRKQGLLIKKYRTFHGLTQQQVGDAIGVTKMAVRLWEKGENSPVAVNQIALAKVLQTPWHVLFGLDDEDVA